MQATERWRCDSAARVCRQLTAATVLLFLLTAQAAASPAQRSFPADHPDHYLFQSFQTADSRQRLRLHHIGVIYEQLGEHFAVGNLLEGYPGQQAGLRRGDVLLSANGSDFHPIASFNAASTDAGPVRLDFLREGHPHSLELTPVYESLYDSYRSASLNSISMSPSGNKLVCYLHWWSASRSLGDLLADRQMFANLRSCDGLILDLRDALGYFDWQHLDHFFSSRRSYPAIGLPDSEVEFQAPAPESSAPMRGFGRPMVVLVNEGTRGGMVMLARQLIHSGRAQSVGMPSEGFLVPAEYLPLPLAAQVRKAAVLINGEDVREQVVTPDVVEPWPLQQPGSRDPQFDAALFALMGVI